MMQELKESLKDIEREIELLSNKDSRYRSLKHKIIEINGVIYSIMALRHASNVALGIKDES